MQEFKQAQKTGVRFALEEENMDPNKIIEANRRKQADKQEEVVEENVVVDKEE